MRSASTFSFLDRQIDTDQDLRALAKQEGKKFAGSTSSLSGMLTHIYFLISRHKDVELTTLSQHFTQEVVSFPSSEFTVLTEVRLLM